MIDLRNSIVNIYGPGTSGKSNFIKYLMSRPEFQRHVIFDPMEEYPEDEYNVYRPKAVDYSEGGNEELNKFLEAVMTSPREKRPRYIVVDEAANFIPGGNKPVGAYVNRLAYHNTHTYPGMTLITSNRHPTDLDPTVREMYQHTFVFGLRGSNSKRAADELATGLSDAVEGLGEYEFIHVGPRGDMTKFSPVDDMGTYERV